VAGRLDELEAAMVAGGPLWTPAVAHGVAPAIDPRWGTRMSFLVCDSQSSSFTIRLHKAARPTPQPKTKAGRTANICVPLAKVEGTLQEAEFSIKVPQIAAGRQGSLRNWVSLSEGKSWFGLSPLPSSAR